MERVDDRDQTAGGDWRRKHGAGCRNQVVTEGSRIFDHETDERHEMGESDSIQFKSYMQISSAERSFTERSGWFDFFVCFVRFVVSPIASKSKASV